MRRAAHALGTAFRANVLLGVLGLALPLVVVLGTAIAVAAAQDILGQDWDGIDAALPMIQVGMTVAVGLAGLAMFRSVRLRPAGAGILLGILVVLLLAAAVLAFWVAVVVVWGVGCSRQGGC